MATNKEYGGPDFERIGLFKEMSYLKEHVPAQTTSRSHTSKPQCKGKQMMTSSTKTKNGTADGYFNKEYPRLFEGEDYIDPIRLRRLQRLKQAKGNIGPGFKYASPTKKQNGKGSNYGTFVEYEKKLEYFSSQTKDKEKSELPKKNFLTNPPKKGSYGYSDITIGKLPPYFLERDYENLKNESQQPKKAEPRLFEPYRAGIFQQKYFDANPYLTDKELSSEIPAANEPTDTTKDKPFLPTSPAKKDGGMKAGCLEKFPEYVGDLYSIKQMATRGVKSYYNAENKMFRPVPGPKPYPVKSIIAKNVERKVTPKNFSNIKGVVYCVK